VSAGGFDALLRSDRSARLRFSRPSDPEQLVVSLSRFQVGRLVEFLGRVVPPGEESTSYLIGGPADISREYQ
jgi:hypothetical protein